MWMTRSRSKRLILGMVTHPTFNDGNPYNGYINVYYWVGDHPLSYGNTESLDPSTCDIWKTNSTFLFFRSLISMGGAICFSDQLMSFRNLAEFQQVQHARANHSNYLERKRHVWMFVHWSEISLGKEWYPRRTERCKSDATGKLLVCLMISWDWCYHIPLKNVRLLAQNLSCLSAMWDSTDRDSC